jgi:hypothetical protein
MMVFYFTNIVAEVLFHILGYSFCPQHHLLAPFCRMLLPSKAQKIISANTVLLLHHKFW